MSNSPSDTIVTTRRNPFAFVSYAVALSGWFFIAASAIWELVDDGPAAVTAVLATFQYAAFAGFLGCVLSIAAVLWSFRNARNGFERSLLGLAASLLLSASVILPGLVTH
jgi:hypothetical protein